MWEESTPRVSGLVQLMVLLQKFYLCPKRKFMEIITAFSTNDGKTFVDKHSGDARFLIFIKSRKKILFS